jgi:hypothetical protein
LPSYHLRIDKIWCAKKEKNNERKYNEINISMMYCEPLTIVDELSGRTSIFLGALSISENLINSSNFIVSHTHTQNTA